MARRVSTAELIGRDAELAVLRERLDAARAGSPAVVLLGGEAGVGKSRLLDEVLDDAAAGGLRVAVGHCVDLGGGTLPFAPVAEALRQLTRDLDRARLAELLGSRHRELARLVPELAGADTGPVEDDPEARAQLFVALRDVLERLAGDRGVVLALEDVHWADTSTLDLVGVLARHVRDEPLLVVVTFRSDELHRRHPLRPVLGELARLPVVERMDLDVLSDDEVAAQAAGILGRRPQPGVVAELVGRSGGNAFYVEELLAAGEDAGGQPLPPGLRDVLAARLERLPAETREVLAAAAAAGPAVSHALMEVVTGQQGEPLVTALKPAVEKHVLVVDGDRYRFRHALVQEVVYEDLLPGERTALHRAVAEALAANPGWAAVGPDYVDAELAHHWHAAHETDRALRASLRAAEHAGRTAAFGEALQHYERALELWDAARLEGDGSPDRLAVLTAAAQTARDAGHELRAVGHLRAALDQPGAAAPEREADLRRRLAGALWGAGHSDAAVAEADRAHALVADAAPSPAQVDALVTYAQLQLMAVHRDPGEGAEPARRARSAARQLDDPLAQSQALRVLGLVLAWTGAIDEGIGHLREALALARTADDPSAVRSAYGSLFDVVYLRDQARGEAACRELAEEIVGWLDAGGNRGLDDAGLLVWVAYGFLRSGEWDRADVTLDRLARTHLEGYHLIGFHTVCGTARWMQGQLDEAAAHAAQAREAGVPPRWYHDFLPLEAEIAAAQGRIERVRAIADEHQAVDIDPTEEPTRLATLRALLRAEVDAAVGGLDREAHVGRAADAVARMREVLERFPPPTAGTLQLELPRTYLDFAEAERSRVTGPDPERWRAAAAQAAYPYWRVYARWRLGEALLGVDAREDAAAELRAAHAEAARLGAEGVAEAVAALARRARITLPGVEAAGPGDLGLTAREQEVLALVAEGRTNREIAETLYIAEKTASVHVSRVLAKLGVANRRKAAVRAGDLGLVESR